MRTTIFRAFLTTVVFAALVFAVFGYTQLWTDAEVIPERDAGTLIGPTMFAVTAMGFFGGLLWAARGRADARSPVPVIVAITFGSALLYALSGAIITLFATGLPGRFLIFLGSHLVSPFAIGVSACALVSAVGFLLISPSRYGG